MGEESAIFDGKIEQIARKRRFTGIGKNRTAKIEGSADQRTEVGERPRTAEIRILDGTEEPAGQGEKSAPLVSRIEEEPKKRKYQRKTVKKDAGSEKQAAVMMISGLIGTVTAIVSTRVGEEWAFSEEECNMIASPMVSIMERYNILDKMGQYGDFLALAAALGMTIVPRVKITQQKIAQKRRLASHVPQRIQKSQSSGQPGAANAAPATDDGSTQGSGSAGAAHVPPSIKAAFAGIDSPI